MEMLRFLLYRFPQLYIFDIGHKEENEAVL